VRREAGRVDGDADEGGGRDDGDQRLLHREVGGVEDAECRAAVLHVREVEKAGNDRPAGVQRDEGAYERLRHLVGNDDEAAEHERDAFEPDRGPGGRRRRLDARLVGHACASATACAQRSHKPASSGPSLSRGT
jgi:hypothetical protein